MKTDKDMLPSEILKTIELCNLSVRKIPNVVISIYEVTHFKEGDELIIHGGRGDV